MAFLIPPLRDTNPLPASNPGLKAKGVTLGPLLIITLACMYVGVVILLPALSVVFQAFA